MGDVRRIGLRAVPDDADIAKFLGKLSNEYQIRVDEICLQLNDTLNQTIKAGEPPIFALGKLLNYLAILEKPELIEILAGVLWKDAW